MFLRRRCHDNGNGYDNLMMIMIKTMIMIMVIVRKNFVVHLKFTNA